MVNVDELTRAIVGQLEDYGREITAEMKQAIDKTAKGMNHVIKQAVPFQQRTGAYVRAFAVKTTYEDDVTKVKTWYVKKPQYRLTHLLENGHYIVKHGKRVSKVSSYPHIKKGEEWAATELEQRIREAVNGH